MMTLNLRRALIAVPAALLFFQVGVGFGQEVPQGEATADATFSGPGVTAAHSVTQIGITPTTPNVLKFGQNITVTFSYDTTQVGGVRIWARPISLDEFGNDILTPNYAACGSPLYPVGSGTGSCTITIVDGDVTVDKIRIQMWNDAQTVRLFNVKLPVHFKYR
jgi:hypothetical protein